MQRSGQNKVLIVTEDSEWCLPPSSEVLSGLSSCGCVQGAEVEGIGELTDFERLAADAVLDSSPKTLASRER
jgi:hypothetical protein